MVDNEWLQAMAAVNIVETDPASLVDIQEVSIKGQTAGERLESFLNQIKNPYCFKVGKVSVRVSFSKQGKALEEILPAYFTSLKM